MEIRKLMNKDTILYIEVPHEEIMRTAEKGEELPTKKKHWHEHINFFTEKSLERLFTKCGLSIIELKQLEADVAGDSVCLFQMACKLT